MDYTISIRVSGLLGTEQDWQQYSTAVSFSEARRVAVVTMNSGVDEVRIDRVGTDEFIIYRLSFGRLETVESN